MIMVTSTEEGDSIVSQAILVKKNLAEGLKVHLRSGRFPKSRSRISVRPCAR